MNLTRKILFLMYILQQVANSSDEINPAERILTLSCFVCWILFSSVEKLLKFLFLLLFYSTKIQCRIKSLSMLCGWNRKSLHKDNSRSDKAYTQRYFMFLYRDRGEERKKKHTTKMKSALPHIFLFFFFRFFFYPSRYFI